MIYILTRLFHQTSVYVIPSSCSLLFLLKRFELNHLDEYQNIPKADSLLQFVNLHQLLGKFFVYHQSILSLSYLDQHFAFNLIQGNNLCLQLKYLRDYEQHE